MLVGGPVSEVAAELKALEAAMADPAAQRALNAKQQQAAYERQQAMLAKELAFIERFKARASHAAQVQSRQKKLEKTDKLEPPRPRQSVVFEFKPPPPIERGRVQGSPRGQGLRRHDRHFLSELTNRVRTESDPTAAVEAPSALGGMPTAQSPGRAPAPSGRARGMRKIARLQRRITSPGAPTAGAIAGCRHVSL